MCGFVGSYTPQDPTLMDPHLLQRMTDTILHRGPDSQHLSREPGLGLGFCRLSIVDLAGGQQPIVNEDGNLVMVCNGEIYNHRELRAELKARGHRFNAAVDVEVMVHLYEEYGADFVTRLNGQFAFALFDRAKGRLILGRDHTGIAPLFWVWRQGTLLFASEIKALLEHPLVGRGVDLTALDQVVTFPGPVSPRTLFAEVASLPPGHLLEATADGSAPATRCYWDLEYPRQADLDPAAVPDFDELEARLHRAVSRRLQADVDVGFYLSGGLDSSLIAALIGAVDRTEGVNRGRHAFSIGFPDARIDERRHQETMAARLGAQHHTELFGPDGIERWLHRAVVQAEAPLKESYNTCSLALSSLVQRNGLKVVLTGEGADELFGGYVGYRLDRQRRDAGAAFGLEAELEREVRRTLWGDPDLFYEKDYAAFSEVKTALYAPRLAGELDRFDACGRALIDPAKIAGRHPVHQRSYVDAKVRLADHLLADHGDRVAAAHSIEARYPFLDPEVIDWARTAPPDWLVHQQTEKYPLRRVAARHVPEEIVAREKFGFVAPSSAALLQRRVDWVEDLLSYERIRRAGYFNADTVERLKTRYRAPGFDVNTTFDTDLLMIVLTFEMFRDAFGVPAL